MILKTFMKIAAIASFVCAVGLGPALAQNIFLTPNNTTSSTNDSAKGGEASKGRIFLSPQGRLSDEARKPAIKYRDKLVVKAMKKQAIDKIRTLQEWEAAGMQPQNIEEQMMYAQAKRAVAQNMMYDRREQVMARIEKQQQIVEARLASEAKAALKTDGSKGDTRIKTVIETEQAEALAEEESAPTMSKAQAAQLAAQEAAEKRQTRSVRNTGTSWMKVLRKDDSSGGASSSSGEKKSRVFTNF